MADDSYPPPEPWSPHGPGFDFDSKSESDAQSTNTGFDSPPRTPRGLSPPPMDASNVPPAHSIMGPSLPANANTPINRAVGNATYDFGYNSNCNNDPAYRAFMYNEPGALDDVNDFIRACFDATGTTSLAPFKSRKPRLDSRVYDGTKWLAAGTPYMLPSSFPPRPLDTQSPLRPQQPWELVTSMQASIKASKSATTGEIWKAEFEAKRLRGKRDRMQRQIEAARKQRM